MDDETYMADREFRTSVQMLALEPAEQVRVNQPCCTTCELATDYEAWSESYLSTHASQIAAAQIRSIQNLTAALDSVPQADFECWNNAVLHRDSWHQVRAAARTVLSAFGWPLEAPPELIEVSKGVFQRWARAQKGAV
jgi:hypothetical protein